ncbi:MAG: tRNA uridine-5-carboxymethylaminomethyl(34) synthesis GTPase MnmE [bacterium]
MNTTITAIATAPGRGAIAVIRVSGPKSLGAYKLLTNSTASPTPNQIKPAWIYEGKQKIDHAMMVYFKAPNSFTGEDVVEIHCHGSKVVQRNILDVLFADGIEAAKPGEFSERAYYNGKIDVAQAEAIMELVSAENTQLARLATRQLAGEFSKQIKNISGEVTKLGATLAADLDFSEEDLPLLDSTMIAEALASIITKINIIKAGSEILPKLREGINVALIGLPNAGKSTLLNTLLGFDRSIVSSQAGTTRDTINETAELGGINYQFIDTAGLNSKPGEIEKIGIEKSIENIKSADIILLLIEPGQEPQTKAFIEFKNLQEYIDSPKTIKVFTKSDIGNNKSKGIQISALKKSGIKDLTDKIISLSLDQAQTSLQILTERQLNIINRVEQALTKLEDEAQNLSFDIISAELELVAKDLNELTGEHANQQIIDSIFRNFCIGK